MRAAGRSRFAPRIGHRGGHSRIRACAHGRRALIVTPVTWSDGREHKVLGCEWAPSWAVTVLVARGGAAALLREAEPVRDSLLQAARESVSDKVMLVVKQSARLLSRPKAKPP
jgi:hypothetical protein